MTIAVAHRGESRGCVENTVDAVVQAVLRGTDVVEVDLRRTGDGTVVVHHDETLSRVWGQPGSVSRSTAAQLLRRIPWIPTLRELLSVTRGQGVPLLLDVRGAEVAVAAYRVAVQESALGRGAGGGRDRWRVGEALSASELALRPEDRVWFCGPPRALAGLRRLDPGLTLALSWRHPFPPSRRLLAEVEPTIFNPWHRWLNERVVRSWRERGTPVCTWTVDDAARRQQLIGWGIDAIISNDVPGTVTAVARGAFERGTAGLRVGIRPAEAVGAVA